MIDFANMTQEQFNALVLAKVEEQLSSREEAEARREAEEALVEAQETFETLRASIEAKDAKLREYEEALANLDVDPSAAEVAANGRIVELENELEKATHRAEVAEAALTTLAREETAASRMSELEEEGLSLEEDAAEAQYAKVREMTDEEFDSYKSELSALKSKYSSSSVEEREETEMSTLSADEIKMIAQSLGCDPSDSKCISLVQEVAERMSEVSNNRRVAKSKSTQDNSGEAGKEETETATQTDLEEPKKEKASLSLGEAITRALDQNIQANASLKEEMSQAWADYYAEKRGTKKTE